MDDILDYDGPEPVEYDIDAPEPFTITDDDLAEWAMRKYAAYRSRIAAAERIAEKERARIDWWLDDQKKKHERHATFFQGLLERYALSQREVDGRKSIDLPHGVIKTRIGQPKYEITDLDAFADWANDHAPDLIETVVKPSIAGLRSAAEVEVTDTLGPVAVVEGLIVPGVTVTPAEVKAVVEVSK